MKIIANLKMNLKFNEIKDYIKKTKDLANDKDFIICPTDIYIPYFLEKGYTVGAQNVSFYDEGAFTGKTSASQLSSTGVKYVILGHSERRMYCDETSEKVNLKVHKAIDNDLKVILCIKDTEDEKKAGLTKDVIRNQIEISLKDIDSKDIIIAYEPVWSIGTGITPTNEYIEEMIEFINFTCKKVVGHALPVVYGGSVNEHNIESLSKIKTLDGFLVGQAALNPEKIIKIREITK